MTERFYDDKEAMSPEKRKDYHNERARWVIDYAYQNAPAWKEKLDRSGVNPSTIVTVEDLQKIPVTSIPELLEEQRTNPPFGGFLAVPASSLRRIFMAMGPEVYCMGFTSPSYDAGAKSLYAAGVRKGDILLNTMPYHPTYGGMMADKGAGRLGVTIIPAGPGNVELKIEAIQRIKPTVYMGTGSFLIALIKRAEELGYDFHNFSIRLAMLGAEKLAPSLRKVFEDDYGIMTAESYGVGGIGLVAYECGQRSGMHIAEEFIVEVVDPSSGKWVEPGEPGEAVITSFDENCPLIRLGSGDLVSYTDEPCSCGRTSRRFTSIIGRTTEAVKVRALFLHRTQLEQAIAGIPQISQFQAVVTREEHKDILTINIELESDTFYRKEIQKIVQENVHEICRLKVDNVNLVPSGTIPEESKRIVDERIWE